eukprot:gb/GFBE01075069.1/.p1 GENE.gb/GFBE01075069.1/~~gb/GFBE01075069.1/.p1  ORF type:complete len:432 (+),score=111.38 gb/GFBE01075069.1/:1-1296(+)
MTETRVIPVVQLETDATGMPQCFVGQKVCVPGEEDEICIDGSIMQACYTPRCQHVSLWVAHEGGMGAEEQCPIFYMEGKPSCQDTSAHAAVHLSVYHMHRVTAKDEGTPWHPEAADSKRCCVEMTEVKEQQVNKELSKEEKTCFAYGLPSRTCRFILGHEPTPSGASTRRPSDILEFSEAMAEDVIQLDTMAVSPKAGRGRRASSGVFCPEAESRGGRNNPFNGSWLFDDGQNGQDGLWEAFLNTAGAVFTKADASLVDHSEDFIINPCDCISQCVPAADVLARRIFSKYPGADVYQQRKMGAESSKPGTASCKGVVINLFYRFVPGMPLPSAQDLGRSPYAEALLALQEQDALVAGDDWVDSASMRLLWFRHAMEDLASQLAKVHCPSKSRVFIGMPSSIGEAEDMAPEFLAAVHTFAADHPWLKISIYE